MIAISVPKLILNPLARGEWCLLPYPGHPKGCPNYNRSKICPPVAPLVVDFVDLERPLWFVVVDFNLKEHVARMMALHPNWSGRQTRCVLYWQGGVKSRLVASAKQFCSDHPGTHHTLCPEAMGVNVFATARGIGLPIRPNPTELVFKIALIGYKKEVV